MKKGINTLDGMIAFILMIMLANWIQNFEYMHLSSMNEQGMNEQAKALSINFGRQANAFYSLNPSPGDSLELTDFQATLFGKATLSKVITKQVNTITVELLGNESSARSDYPAAPDLQLEGMRLSP